MKSAEKVKKYERILDGLVKQLTGEHIENWSCGNSTSFHVKDAYKTYELIQRYLTIRKQSKR